jgi:hypothetical protein
MESNQGTKSGSSLMLLTLGCLLKGVLSSYFLDNSSFHLFYQYDNNSSKVRLCNNESFFITFENMTLSHSNCSVETVNAMQPFTVKPFDKDVHNFSSIEDLNLTFRYNNSEAITFPDKQDSFLLDYSIEEADSTSCILEQALHFALEKTKPVWMGVTKLLQRWHCFANDSNSTRVMMTDLKHKDANVHSIIIKHVQVFELKAFFDLVITPSGTSNGKLEFRTGVLIAVENKVKQTADNREWYEPKLESGDIRPVILRDIEDDFIKKKETEVTSDAQQLQAQKKLKNFKMISLGTFNFQFRQFLIYEVNTTMIHVVTCFNTGSKTSNITAWTGQMPFNFSSITYVSNEFLLFESPTNVTDVNGKNVSTYMNYFIRLALSQRLEGSMLLNYKNLTKGKFLTHYSSVDRYLKILDFQMPDLDGKPDETLVSSFYFSKPDVDFLQFLEESSASNPMRAYDPESFKRMVSSSHVFETYRTFNNNTDTNTYLAVFSRTTGGFLGEVSLPTTQNLTELKFIESENVLVLRFDKKDSKDLQPSIFFFSFKRPSIYFRLLFDPANENKDAKDLNKDTITLKVTCDFDPSKTQIVKDQKPLQRIEIFRTNFVMHSYDNDYFIKTAVALDGSASSTSAKGKPELVHNYSAKVYPEGLTFSKEVSTLISGSFLETHRLRSTFNEFYSNPNLRTEFYEVELPTLKINTPIFFETRKGNKQIRSLVMDLESETTYYRFKHSKFEVVKNALDNRKVSKVDMIGEGDAIFNVSQNIFSLDIEDLIEKPLTGIGSFCQSVAYLRPPNLPDLILCLSANGLEAHYMQERFASQQTNIAINYKGYADFVRYNTPVRLLYSREFPSVLLIMALKNQTQQSKQEYIIGIFELYSVNDIYVSFTEQVFELTQLNVELTLNTSKNQSNSIVAVDIHEGNIVIATKSNSFFVYSLISRTNQKNWITVEYQKTFNLQDHFIGYSVKDLDTPKYNVSLELEVSDIDKIWMYKSKKAGDSYQSEPIYERRLIFMLEVKRKVEKEEPAFNKTHKMLVIFDHRKSSYEAFATILSGVDCKNLFTGPAFLLEGEKQRRTLALICVPKSMNEPTPGQKVIAKVAILESFENLISFRTYTDINDYFNRSQTPRPSSQTSVIHYYKSKYLLEMTRRYEKLNRDIDKIRNDSLLKEIRVSDTFFYNFTKTYKSFKIKNSLNKELTSVKMDDHGVHFEELLGHIHNTTHKKKITDYFDGHVFKTSLECESGLECRDGIVNGTFQEVYSGTLAVFSDYIKAQDSYHLEHIWMNKSYNQDFEMSYIMSKSAFNFSFSGKMESVSLGKLGQNCSQFASYEHLLVGLCSYNESQNFFRIFDINGDMAFVDIQMQLPNSRFIHPRNVRIGIREDYLSLFTFSTFFNRYLTTYIFKIVTDPAKAWADNPRFFYNRLLPGRGLWFLVESPMNDENVEPMIYRSYLADGSPKPDDRIYLWSLRHLTPRSLGMRAVGFLVNEIKDTNNRFILTVSNVCDEKTLTLSFDLDVDNGASYLLKNAKVMPLEDFSESNFDVILNLPSAHDYLVRFKRSSLEKTTTSKLLNAKDDALFLCISNPFFGLRPSESLRSEFGQELYLVSNNYFPTKGLVRGYYLSQDVKDKAKVVQTDQLFNFALDDTDGGVKSLLEKEMETIYSFGLLNSSTLMISVVMQEQGSQVKYYKKKLNGKFHSK